MPASVSAPAPGPVSGPPPEGRSYGGESPDDRVARRRRQLLEAGLETFGTVGYRAATVRGVCRTAQVTDRYFYESFAGLEDLLLAVYDECMERLMRAVVEALAGQADDAALEDVARTGLEAFFAEAHDERLARVVWLEVLGVSPRVDRAYTHSIRVFAHLLVARLRVALAGEALPLPAEEEAILSVAAVGGINQAAMAWLLERYATPRERVVSATTRYLVAVGRSLGA